MSQELQVRASLGKLKRAAQVYSNRRAVVALLLPAAAAPPNQPCKWPPARPDNRQDTQTQLPQAIDSVRNDSGHVGISSQQAPELGFSESNVENDQARLGFFSCTYL